MGLGQGDQAGPGQGRGIERVFELAEIVDGQLAGHGVSQQQAIVIGERQPARGFGGRHIQPESAVQIIGLQPRGLEQADPEPASLGVEDDAVGSMAGGDGLFQLEVGTQQQQAVATVVGHQQGAVGGPRQLAQISPKMRLFDALAAVPCQQGDGASALIGGEQARGAGIVVGNQGAAHLLGVGQRHPEQHKTGEQARQQRLQHGSGAPLEQGPAPGMTQDQGS
ncbi:hypothetical protein D3C78_1191160 [compost metagenome]